MNTLTVYAYFLKYAYTGCMRRIIYERMNTLTVYAYFLKYVFTGCAAVRLLLIVHGWTAADKMGGFDQGHTVSGHFEIV